MASHRASQWLHRVASAATVIARNDSVLGLLLSVKAGVGIGPLPTALGDSEEGLVRVLGPIVRCREIGNSSRCRGHGRRCA